MWQATTDVAAASSPPPNDRISAPLPAAHQASGSESQLGWYLRAAPCVQPNVLLQSYTCRLVVRIGPSHLLNLGRDGGVVLGPVIAAGGAQQFPLVGVALPDHAIIVDTDRLQPNAEFYQARLDEDEAGAKDATYERHDPNRVLREVEAGRKLTADYRGASETFEQQMATHEQDATMPGVILAENGPAYSPQAIAEIIEKTGPAGLATITLRREVARRAAVWSDHPDWRREWVAEE